MVRREITQYFDDLDKTPLTQAELNVVKFSLDGSDYTLDLSVENAAKLRELLKPYVQVAAKDTSRSQRRRTPVENNVQTKFVRAWAVERGMAVAPRGKLQQSVFDEYYKAHNM